MILTIQFTKDNYVNKLKIKINNHKIYLPNYYKTKELNFPLKINRF